MILDKYEFNVGLVSVEQLLWLWNKKKNEELILFRKSSVIWNYILGLLSGITYFFVLKIKKKFIFGFQIARGKVKLWQLWSLNTFRFLISINKDADVNKSKSIFRKIGLHLNMMSSKKNMFVIKWILLGHDYSRKEMNVRVKKPYAVNFYLFFLPKMW